jgi:Protein of unknown function (DUF2721)
MPATESAPIIQHAIQLAVAPVFLLSGVAGLLAVMAGRLARIIDRARHLEQEWAMLDEKALARGKVEISILEQRRSLASWSINFCAGAALLVCTVIVTLFFEEFLGANLKWFAGAQFVAAMIALLAGLSTFLREVYLATHTGRIEAERFTR